MTAFSAVRSVASPAWCNYSGPLAVSRAAATDGAAGRNQQGFAELLEANFKLWLAKH